MAPGQGALSGSRSIDVWFEDGNIIIQAEQTQFKVHRSVLAAQSSVFGDMFSIPQPPSAENEAVNGCPVVHVTDSAIDIAIVLQALFLRGYVSREALSITVVAAFVRIGTKYEIEILRTEGLKRLFYEYPTNLSDYDGRDACSRIADSGGVVFDVANLAREQNLLSVLPFALYWLSSESSANELASGVPRDDGTTATISTTDVIACLIAREYLAEVQKKSTCVWMNPPLSTQYSSCETPEKCAESRLQVMMAILLLPTNYIRGLSSWRHGPGVDNYVDGMCSECQQVAKKLHMDGRVEFWNKLPGTFGLPEWVEINKERAAFTW